MIDNWLKSSEARLLHILPGWLMSKSFGSFLLRTGQGFLGWLRSFLNFFTVLLPLIVRIRRSEAVGVIMRYWASFVQDNFGFPSCHVRMFSLATFLDILCCSRVLDRVLRDRQKVGELRSALWNEGLQAWYHRCIELADLLNGTMSIRMVGRDTIIL